MKITIKQLQGPECCIEVLPTTYIAEIKKDIEDKLDIPREYQKLMLMGRALADQNTVESYPTIKDGTKLNLVVKKPDGLYEVCVKYYRKTGMSETDAMSTAARFVKIVDDKFDQLSWDDIERLSMDCLLDESGEADASEMEPEQDDVYSL